MTEHGSGHRPRTSTRKSGTEKNTYFGAGAARPIRPPGTAGTADDATGRAGRRRPELTADRRSRPGRAGGFSFPRENLPLRPRADPRAGRACPWLRGARFLRELRTADRHHPGRSVLRGPAKTPAFVRFSTVAGNKGSADLARDVRGFAVKLYTKEGNWDLVGNNIPVFFIQDAIKFPDLIHAAKAGARPRLPAGADRARQFLGFHLADARKHAHGSCGSCPTGRSRARSASWKGFGVHTFRLVNARGQIDFRQVSLEAEARACSRWSGTRR